MNFKNLLFDEYAKVAKAFSSGARLQLIESLIQCSRNVEDLAKIINQSIANTSKHLQILKDHKIISSTRHGKHVVYALTDLKIIQIFLAIQDIAHQNIEEVDSIVAEYLNNKDSMDAVDVLSLIKKIERHEIIVLDIRPQVEYESAHFPKAINVTLADLKDRLKKLPKNKTILAYCRGKYCVLSYEAVKQLRDSGFHAFRTSEGIPEWIAAGVPLQSLTNS